MSDVVRDLSTARSAFTRPTLKMLNHPNADFFVAMFVTLFPADQPRVEAGVFLARIDVLLQELLAHDPETPSVTARDLCSRWVTQQWLTRTANNDGGEDYSLTSHAQEALEFIQRMSTERAMFGESRIRTIVEAAQRFASVTNPDPAERIRRQEERVAREQAELERLRAGGSIETATDDQFIDEYRNLAALLAALPSDFLRVTEKMKELRTSIMDALRKEQFSIGESIDDYLTRRPAHGRQPRRPRL